MIVQQHTEQAIGFSLIMASAPLQHDTLDYKLKYMVHEALYEISTVPTWKTVFTG